MQKKLWKIVFCFMLLLSSYTGYLANDEVQARELMLLEQTQETNDNEQEENVEEIQDSDTQPDDTAMFIDGQGNVLYANDMNEEEQRLAKKMFPDIMRKRGLERNQIRVSVPYGLVSDPASKWCVTFDRYNDTGLNWDCYAQYEINGAHAFCIQPLRASVNGASDYDEQAFQNLIENAEVQRELSYIESLGYGFADDYSDEMDWATQIRLWQCLHAFNADEFPQVQDIHEEIQEKIDVINHRMAVMELDVSMKDTTIAIKGVGESYAEYVRDTTNTLADYVFRNADEGIRCEQVLDDSGRANTLKIWLDKPVESGQITYDAWYPADGEDYAIFYASDSSQGLATLGKSQPNAFSLQVSLHKGDLQLVKVDEDGKRVKDTTFEVSTTKDMKSVIGSYTTAEDGSITIPDLIPQTVYVKEVSVPKHLVLDERVYEVLLKADECVTFQAQNEWIKGTVELIKKDRETKASVSGAIYGIYDADGKEVQRLTTSSKGYVKSGQLRYGTYTIRELHAPSGYVLNKKEMRIRISAHNERVVVEGDDQPVKGTIRLYKEGEVLVDAKKDKQNMIQFVYEKRRLADAEYGVFANNDIYAADGVTRMYQKGECVDTLKTDKKGGAVSKQLPLGSYLVKETAAPDGFTLSDETREVVLSWKDETTLVVQADAGTFQDQRTNVAVTANKLDAETKEFLADAQITLFANKDIKNVDGKVIVKKGTAIETLATSTAGKVSLKADLPVYRSSKEASGAESVRTDKDKITYKGNEDSLFYIKETKAPLGYTQCEPIVYYVDTQSKATQSLISLSYTFENSKTTIELYKVDEQNTRQAGNHLQLYDRKQQLVEEWITDDKAHVIEKLLVGESYVLKEISAVDGYTCAKDISFTVKNQREPQSITMQNEQLIVSVLKTDDEDQPLAGAQLRIYDDGGNIVDTWTSQDTAHTIPKLKEHGHYTLREEEAPKGYTKAKDVTFIAEQGTQIQLKNNKAVITVQTGDSTNRNLILLLFAGSAVLMLIIIKKSLKKRC